MEGIERMERIYKYFGDAKVYKMRHIISTFQNKDKDSKSQECCETLTNELKSNLILVAIDDFKYTSFKKGLVARKEILQKKMSTTRSSDYLRVMYDFSVPNKFKEYVGFNLFQYLKQYFSN